MSFTFGAPYGTARMVFWVWSAGVAPAVLIGYMSGRQSDSAARIEAVGREPLLNLCLEGHVAREVLLARTAPGPLARDDRATLEDLAAPDAPRLGTLHGAGEALDAQRAVPAERLGQLQLGRGVGEPQVRVELPTGQVRLQLDVHVEGSQRQTHTPGHLSLSRSFVSHRTKK